MVPPPMEPSRHWQRVEYMKFPQRLTWMQKRMFQRQRVAERKEKEHQLQDQVMQEVELDNKSKFRRKAIKDPNSSKEESVGSLKFSGSMKLDEVMEINTFKLEGDPLPFGCATTLVILP